ncbi:MAG: hypothetical protein K0R49_1617 [Burkholderiales bacterium]|jgi:hypothetical protein|nr:hypothetical protein [Burkholderiales bacterium]
MRETKKIDSVLEDARSLQDLSQKFSKLDELNQILHKILPEHLINHCHIGAVDNDKNLVILYLDNSTLKHIFTGMANQILESFNNHHYSFAGIITRIRLQTTTNSVRRKPLTPKVKSKLTQLAQSINRPDLIEDVAIIDKDKEIDL